MVVDVIVIVDAPVIVAVHLNGNDTVVVIRPVDGSWHPPVAGSNCSSASLRCR